MPLAPRLAPGSIFARDFKVVDLLAEGGMGAVYRAEQLSTRKMRALKLVSTRLASDPKGRQRFVREATVGASIDSVHVVEVIGAGFDEDSARPWLAMELLDGADLGAIVRHQGPLDEGQLREVVSQLCHGLAAAHGAGVVHRDLKPANVFVARSRRGGVPFTIKILDFGIAKVVQESGSGGTETDTVGSPLWMAPEQLNAQRPTPATDVWALGLLAFWALTGKHYWLAAHADSSTVQALFVEQLFKPFAPPAQRAQQLRSSTVLPDGFDAWFLRCIDREPGRRFADAGLAGAALQGLLSPDPEAAKRLLPGISLRPSVEDTERAPRGSSETTVAAGPTAWEASAVVPPAALEAARSRFEDEATRADPLPQPADLSYSPLPGDGAPAVQRSGVSAWAVMLSVSVVAAVVAGGAYMAWRWQAPSASASLAAATPRSIPSTPAVDAQGSTSTSGSSAPDAETGELAGGSSTGATADAELDAAANLALEPVVPLRTQLSAQAHALKFLGWTPSGHRFVLRAEHHDDAKGRSDRLSLVQVHDALTGQMIESFVMNEAGQAEPRGYSKLGRAAAEAQPRGRWSERRKALQLDKRAPSGRSPTGGKLRISSEQAPEGTTMSFPRSELGVAFRWSGLGTASLPDSRGPRTTIEYQQGSERWPLFEISPPFTAAEVVARRLPDGNAPAVVGRLLAYWSPDQTRVVLLFEADARPTGERPLGHRRWGLRGVGPQVRLVEAGAGQRRTRAIAQRLVAAGIPVAVADLREPAAARSGIVLPRGHGATDAVAERIRGALPELPAPERKRLRGWADVVVVLGHDLE